MVAHYTSFDMPMFRRKSDRSTKEADDRPARSRLLDEQDLFDRLDEEIFRADRYGRPLAIACFVPQCLAAPLSGEELANAVDAIRQRLRFCDVIGELRNGSMIAILPETDWSAARVVAQRIGSDLTVRSTAIATRKWTAGASSFPDHGTDPPTMVQHAVDSARG